MWRGQEWNHEPPISRVPKLRGQHCQPQGKKLNETESREAWLLRHLDPLSVVSESARSLQGAMVSQKTQADEQTLREHKETGAWEHLCPAHQNT